MMEDGGWRMESQVLATSNSNCSNILGVSASTTSVPSQDGWMMMMMTIIRMVMIIMMRIYI